ncbi:MAG: hypothetical protein J6Y02_16350 [Pseudobutyrivibrio sp.]|nr:hypothetical protein [Pseudobutyrivibrio sp.]
MNDRITPNQINEFWRNARLTITSIIFPIFGLILLVYYICPPVRNWINAKLEKIFNKKKN